VKLYRQGAGQTTADFNVPSACSTGNAVCNTTNIASPGGCGLAATCVDYHHKSGLMLARKKTSTGRVFRFVNFAICDYANYRHTSPDNPLGGLTDPYARNNMIVTTTVLSDYNLEKTAHEISHTLGAHDINVSPCTSTPCVMNPKSTTNNGKTTLVWCDTHANEIKNFIK